MNIADKDLVVFGQWLIGITVGVVIMIFSIYVAEIVAIMIKRWKVKKE